jgi:hypothetical protein
MPWNDAIASVLRDAGGSLSRTEIAEAIITKKLRSNVGATPASTVVSRISTSLSDEGDQSPFVRVRRGEYALRSLVTALNTAATQVVEKEEEWRAGCIQALGMYWDRNLVRWTNSTKLFGQQQPGATSVDVSKQIGIYLLYDLREVIYVGRSIDRPIGRRLFEHTQDRLRARWNRFSWFGLYPVKEDGSIAEETASQDTSSIVRALEAVLIESLEPRQNRKRGDELSAVEYIQKEDPKIERDRKKALLREMQDSLSGGE